MDQFGGSGGNGLGSVSGILAPEGDVAKLVSSLVKSSMESNLISESDVVTIVHGFLPGVSGNTNTIQVLDMREYLARSSQVLANEQVGTQAAAANAP